MILVDTDVLIANLRGFDAARDWLRDARARTGRLAVSVATNAEIIGGMRALERREVTRLLNSLRPLPVTDMIAHRAGGASPPVRPVTCRYRTDRLLDRGHRPGARP